MSRQITLGEVVIDQFPVLEPDGYTKKTGESAFTATAWRNGIVQAVSVTITEIGTSGEYKVQFTPTALGFWALEILVGYNNDLFFNDYTVFGFADGSPFDPDGVIP